MAAHDLEQRRRLTKSPIFSIAFLLHRSSDRTRPALDGSGQQSTDLDHGSSSGSTRPWRRQRRRLLGRCLRAFVWRSGSGGRVSRRQAWWSSELARRWRGPVVPVRRCSAMAVELMMAAEAEQLDSFSNSSLEWIGFSKTIVALSAEFTGNFVLRRIGLSKKAVETFAFCLFGKV
ncbi:hypothetical protein Dimus_024030 [Dionaea muscipula]